ncbi:MAG: response regulator [Candidatus Cloacimonetes bacterium]|nr:response regulator [Candidatus Cloacimonadota bacterium]
MNILIIEDDDAVREFLRLGLTSMGHDVTVAENGEDGVNTCLNHSFDLVITDMNMPRKNGIEAILEILHLKPDQQVMAISGIPSQAARNNFLNTAYMMGVTNYLVKPFGLSELKKAIGQFTR